MAQLYSEEELKWLDAKMLSYQAFRHFAIKKGWVKPDDGIHTTIIQNSVTVALSYFKAEFEFSVLEHIPAGKDANGRWHDSEYVETDNETSCARAEWARFFAAFIERHTVEEMKKAGPYAILERIDVEQTMA